jgi:glycerol-3-phosphate acyltransferase PlsY
MAKRTMAEADRKNQKTGIIVFSLVFLAAYLAWVIPSSLYSHYYFSNAATVWKTIGFFSIAAHYYFLWMKFRGLSLSGDDKGTSNLLLIGWFLVNILLLSGFNFDLPR